MSVTFASQVRSLKVAVDRQAPWVMVKPFPADPSIQYRVYIRGDLRKIPPRHLQSILKKLGDLAEGAVLKGKHFQVRRVENYFEVFPSKEALPSPFFWERAHALSEAVVLRHNRDVLSSALSNADPRYLAILSVDTHVAVRLLEYKIYAAGIRQRDLDRDKERTRMFPPKNSLGTVAGPMLAHFGTRVSLFDPVDPQSFRSQPLTDTLRFITEALSSYRQFEQEIDPVVGRRLLDDGNKSSASFATFLLSPVALEIDPERELLFAPGGDALEDLDRHSRVYWGEKAIFWGLRYMEKFGRREQLGLLSLIMSVRDWCDINKLPELSQQASTLMDRFSLP